MNLTDHIAQHLIDVHEGDNWTEVNIKNTLADVSAEEAVTVTAFSPNSIAALLYHITFYSKVIVERLNGNDPAIDERNGFDFPALTSEADWQQLKDDNLNAAHQLAEAIKQVSEERLFQPIVPGQSEVYKTLHGVVEHAHYHLGQMVLIKKLLKMSPAANSIH